MSVKVRPLSDYVLVKRSEAQEQRGAIIVPEVARDLPAEGRVLRVGGSVVGINAGELVLFGKYSGVKVIYEGVEYLLLRQSELLGIVEEEEEVIH